MTMIDQVRERVDRFYDQLMSDGCNQESDLSIDALVDSLIALHDQCESGDMGEKCKALNQFLDHTKGFVNQAKQVRPQCTDFNLIHLIGSGAFGNVAIVRFRNEQEENVDKVYALKAMSKRNALKKADAACFKAERDVLVGGKECEWITKIHFCFQDKEHLYILMDYYGGGNLLTLLSTYSDNEILSEQMAQFYTAELILAVDYVHKLGYIHRDVKPDNVLIDFDGHIRLADFGSCIRYEEIVRRETCPGMGVEVNGRIAVGTPDYIPPEALQSINVGTGCFSNQEYADYGFESDWWSVGCCLWEMLYGVPPFFNELLAATYAKVMSHARDDLELIFDDETNEVSDECKDFLRSLLCRQSKRLKKAEDLMMHNFLRDIDFSGIRNQAPPYVPKITCSDDISHFDIDDTRPVVNAFSKLRPGTSLARESHTAYNVNNNDCNPSPSFSSATKTTSSSVRSWSSSSLSTVNQLQFVGFTFCGCVPKHVNPNNCCCSSSEKRTIGVEVDDEDWDEDEVESMYEEVTSVNDATLLNTFDPNSTIQEIANQNNQVIEPQPNGNRLLSPLNEFAGNRDTLCSSKPYDPTDSASIHTLSDEKPFRLIFNHNHSLSFKNWSSDSNTANDNIVRLNASSCSYSHPFLDLFDFILLEKH
ncbi:hypothetical protein ACOME3_009839 [Neoechinorhynchus agilis]